MKTFYLFLLLAYLIPTGVEAQVQTRLSGYSLLDNSGIFGVAPLESVHVLPKIDIVRLLEEDALEESAAVPFRFGYAVDVDLTSQNSGKWFEKPEGRVWKLNIKSEGAYSINLIFDQLQLPRGGELYIYNGDRTMIYGPLTPEVTNQSVSFGTDLIQGGLITLELFEPNDARDVTALKISKAVHAYRDIFSTNSHDDHQNITSACDHNNVNCSGFSSWQSVSNSVAMVLLADGTRMCSGSLVNNTCQNFTPNFLTAFHCIDVGNNMNSCEPEFGNGQLNANEINRAQNWVFRFQYKSPTCDPTSPPTSWVSYNGSTYRAGWATTDFALVEMNNRPVGEMGIQYAGWSRSTTIPTNGATIHHPNHEPMKISTYSNPANHSTALVWNLGCDRVSQTPANSHWTVNLNNGTTEPGSSGGPLFDQNKRIVGQLQGNPIGCAPILRHYGKFNLSWNGGGTAGTRLRDWLDPNNTAVTTNTVPVPSVMGPDRICTSNTAFTLQNVPTGSTVSWAVTPIHLFHTTTRSGTGTTASLRANSTSSSGLATLTFTVATNCGNYQIQKRIWVGVPSASTSIVPNYQPICINEYTYFNAFYDMYGINPAGNKAADITNFIWTPPSGVTCYTSGTKNEVLACYFTAAHAGSSQTVGVRAVNSCGQGALNYASFNPSSCSFFSVGINPNPAQGRVNIELIETPLDEEGKAIVELENKGTREYQEYSFDSPPQRIRIFDIMGVERFCVEVVSEDIRHELDISHLTAGIYVVHLEHKNGTVVRQLRVE